MIAEGGEDAGLGEVVVQLAHRFAQHVQVGRTRLVPHVVRRQIARPNDVVDVLRPANNNQSLVIVARLINFSWVEITPAHHKTIRPESYCHAICSLCDFVVTFSRPGITTTRRWHAQIVDKVPKNKKKQSISPGRGPLSR